AFVSNLCQGVDSFRVYVLRVSDAARYLGLSRGGLDKLITATASIAFLRFARSSGPRTRKTHSPKGCSRAQLARRTSSATIPVSALGTKAWSLWTTQFRTERWFGQICRCVRPLVARNLSTLTFAANGAGQNLSE